MERLEELGTNTQVSEKKAALDRLQKFRGRFDCQELEASQEVKTIVTMEIIKNAILTIIPEYPIKRVVLFGSRAAGTNHNDSDIDLIIEFTESVSLLTLSEIKYRLEDLLGLEVDVIHGPIQKTDLIEVNKEIELYAA